MDAPTGVMEQEVPGIVDEAVLKPTVDFHTHIAGSEHPLCLVGPEHALRYHYSECDLFRTDYGRSIGGSSWYYGQDAKTQARAIWTGCVKEQAIGSTTTGFGLRYLLSQLDLDPRTDSFDHWEQLVKDLGEEEYTNRIFDIAGLKWVTMTNDIGDEQERNFWLEGGADKLDPRFKPVLRCDWILSEDPKAIEVLKSLGYQVDVKLDDRTVSEYRRFIREWVKRMGALYVAISLPPSWLFDSRLSRMPQVIRKAVMPECDENGTPVALMIGVRRGIRPSLGSAGDGVGRANVESVEQLADAFPNVRLFITLLHRDDQYPLAVAARKFDNIIPFGAWWWLNSKQMIKEITEIRYDLLGDTFIWQHSDARITDQLAYKWYVNRRALAEVLIKKYQELVRAGVTVTREEIETQVSVYLNRAELYLAA